MKKLLALFIAFSLNLTAIIPIVSCFPCDDDLGGAQDPVSAIQPTGVVAGDGAIEAAKLDKAARIVSDFKVSVLIFSVGTRKSDLAVVSSKGTLNVSLPSAEVLAKQILTFRSLVAARPTEKNTFELEILSERLYTTLIAPVHHHLTGRGVVVVDDGMFASLPFAALGRRMPNGKLRYAVFDYSFTYAYSLDRILSGPRWQTPKSGDKMVVFADPTLPISAPGLSESRRDAHNIRRLFGESVFVNLGTRATKDSFRALSGPIKLIHISAHRVVGGNSELNMVESGLLIPSASGNVVGEWYLTSQDIASQVFPDLQIVVLAGCSTGIDRKNRTEVMAPDLVAAFSRAGARSVVASLWPVDDIASSDFMDLFYRSIKVGKSPGDSVRDGQLQMLNGSVPVYAHPYYWAAWSVIGQL